MLLVKNLKKYSGINLLILLILMYIPAAAQPSAGYFQQEVNTKIQVSLNDSTHSLQGHIRIEYINHSPDTLNEIFIHLWPNAYRNNKTAFARQSTRTGIPEFYFSKPSQRGYIDSLFFKINGEHHTPYYMGDSIDIARISMQSPLHPGDTSIITTPFYVKIPEVFSRLGHDGQAYYISQWYPKPAVYDQNGWHPMPYLHMGEFYSEFGEFDVKITLPENYRVAATGDLMNAQEKTWLKSVQAQTHREGFPESSKKTKTLHYHAENVHDFAWFADKRWGVDHITWQDSVDIFAFYLPEHKNKWKDAARVISKTLDFFSKHVGNTDYTSFSAVQAHKGAGGGMEYPGVTQISMSTGGKSLERIIMHEVGHNWFYGSLGFNERRYPWLDEGLTSFYEKKYMRHHYSNDTDMFDALISPWYENDLIPELTYKYSRSLGIDQPADLHSDDFYTVNYGTVVYNKTVSAFFYLEAWIGKVRFEQTMQDFFRKWKNKHPGPEDLRRHFETATNHDLSWFFDDIIGSTRAVDYRISKITKDSIFITNAGQIESPVFFGTKDTVIKAAGFSGTKSFPKPESITDYCRIDPEFTMLEFNRSNDKYIQGLFPAENPLKLKFFGGVDDFDKRELYYMPVPAFNGLDGFMPGLLVYNNFIPVKELEYQLLPMYGLETNRFLGTGKINWHRNLYGQENLKRIGITISGKQFSQNEDHAYQKLHACLALDFTHKNQKNASGLKLNFITTSSQNRIPLHYQQLSYHAKKSMSAYLLSANASLEHGAAYIKLSLESENRVKYTAKTGLDIRIFGGYLHYYDFQNHPYNVNFRLAGTNAQSDYLYETTLYNRSLQMSDYEHNAARQFVPDEGGFALYTPVQSDSWLFSLNLSSDTPLPFADIFVNVATLPDVFESDFYDEKFAFYEAGIRISLIKDIAEIYLPVLYSSSLKRVNNGIYSENYWHKIRFRLSLNNLNPFDFRYKTHLLY